MNFSFWIQLILNGSVDNNNWSISVLFACWQKWQLMKEAQSVRSRGTQHIHRIHPSDPSSISHRRHLSIQTLTHIYIYILFLCLGWSVVCSVVGSLSLERTIWVVPIDCFVFPVLARSLCSSNTLKSARISAPTRFLFCSHFHHTRNQ